MTRSLFGSPELIPHYCRSVQDDLFPVLWGRSRNRPGPARFRGEIFGPAERGIARMRLGTCAFPRFSIRFSAWGVDAANPWV